MPSDGLDRYLRAAAARRHRAGVVLSGARGWCRDDAERLLARRADAAAAVLRLSMSTPDRARAVLGGEYDAVLLDAFDGFDADAFGALCGAVRGGGLLLLLCPPLDDWARASRYRARFVRLLRGALYLRQQGLADTPAAPPATPYAASVPSASAPYGSADQQRAVAAVLAAARRRRRPALLLSDRGRGKSAALGLAAAELLAAAGAAPQIGVSAPSPTAVATLFAHAARRLPRAQRRRSALTLGDASLRFHAPDALLRDAPALDFLLVDEAAALPLPLLAGLLERYPRAAFASTVHGYEGSGRGFTQRFQRLLERRSRGLAVCRLREPMRWAAGDPLERFSFDALLLNADADPDADADVADAGAASAPDLVFRRLDRDRLAADEPRLRALFGLLVSAHYRTRPDDLRQLLDAPAIRLYALYRRAGDTAPLAAAALASEGGFSAAAAAQIAAGRRRPPGHLLPELLAAHLGLADAAQRRGARIVRIAVAPRWQRQGLGSLLLRRIGGERAAAGYDYLGTSFAADPELLAFWRRAGYRPARLGLRRDASSGERSAALLRPLNRAGRALTRRASAKFIDTLLHQLPGPLRTLDPMLAAALFAATRRRAAAHGADLRDLHDYCYAKRPYDGCSGAAWRLAGGALCDPARVARLDDRQRALLVVSVLQYADPADAAVRLGLAGRRAVDVQRRAALRALLETFVSAGKSD